MAKYVTKQRLILQDYLSRKLDEELSAKKVAEDLAEQKVSLSAIYRNLAEMEKEHLVVQCSKEGSREFYFRYIGESVCQQSLHLSCRLCHKLEHITPEDTTLFQMQFLNQFHFVLDVPNTVFYGICKQCQT